MSLPPQSEPEFVNGLRSPGIGSKESIPPAYIDWRARVLQIDCTVNFDLENLKYVLL